MKKIIALIGAVCLILNLAACSGKAQPEDISETTSTPTVSTENTDTSRTTPRNPDAIEPQVEVTQENLYFFEYAERHHPQPDEIKPSIIYTAVIENTGSVPANVEVAYDICDENDNVILPVKITIPFPSVINPGERTYIHEDIAWLISDRGVYDEIGNVAKINMTVSPSLARGHKEYPFEVIQSGAFVLEPESNKLSTDNYNWQGIVKGTDTSLAEFDSTMPYVITVWNENHQLLYSFPIYNTHHNVDDDGSVHLANNNKPYWIPASWADPAVMDANTTIEITPVPQLYAYVSTAARAQEYFIIEDWENQ